MPYNRALDGVRGIAILLVMLCHQAILKPSGFWDGAWTRVWTLGWVGVDFFFVLSGFLITTILLHEKGHRYYFQNFYARRILRIFPLYFLFLAVYFWGVPLLPQVLTNQLEPLSDSQFWYWGFASNFLIAAKGHWVQPPLSPTWSLAVEEQFYLLWPLCVAYLPVRRLLQLTGALLITAWLCRTVGSLLGANAIALYVLPWTRADALALGALVAILYQNPANEQFLKRLQPLLRGSLFIGLVINFVWGRDSLLMAAVGYTGIALGGVSLVVSCTRSEAGKMRALLSNSGLVLLGKYSFGMYLLQNPVVGLVASLGLAPKTLPEQWLFHGLCCGLTLGLAALSYHLFEIHFLNLKRVFTRDDDLRARADIPKAA